MGSALFPSAADGLAKLKNSLKNIGSVRDIFKKFDTDGDGEISFAELKSGAKSLGEFSEGELSAVFAMGDVDNDGSISIDEMKAGLKTTGLKFSDEEVEVVFAVGDLDGNNELSLAEFENLMGTAVSFGKVEDVKAAFFRFDKNNDGSIDKAELKQMLAATGKTPSDAEVESLFKKGDKDGDGQIDLQEFIHLMFPNATATLYKLQKSFRNLDEVKASFRKYDTDGDGHISRLELKQVMANFSEAEVDSIFALGDVDKSGGIDYQEFITLMIADSSVVIKKLSTQFKTVFDIKSAFKRFDSNGDGQIDRSELKSGMKLSESDLSVVFALGDLDGDGEISIGEFIRVMSPSTSAALGRFRNSFNSIEDVVSAFRVMDSNADGSLSKEELFSGMNSFGKLFTQEDISSVFALADVNSDGEICYDEFVPMMFPAAASALSKFRRNHRTL